MCRQEYQVIQVGTDRELNLGQHTTEEQEQVAESSSGRSSLSAAAAFQSTMVILPAQAGSSPHANLSQYSYWAAKLPSGQLSIIPDTGAFGSATGSDLAREIALCAKLNGANVTQTKMDKPFTIGGVGHGTQTCNYRLNVDLAVPHCDGTASYRNWKPPIVEGTGSGLPGLLGLDSLEENRAIIDTGNKR